MLNRTFQKQARVQFTRVLSGQPYLLRNQNIEDVNIQIHSMSAPDNVCFIKIRSKNSSNTLMSLLRIFEKQTLVLSQGRNHEF